MKKVLIAGASGYLGSFVTKELKNQNFFVRAISRNSVKIQHLNLPIDELIHAEITKPESLNGCCKGIDFVITTVGITKQKDGLTYMDVDYQGNLNLLEEAMKEGVKKFIYISVFNCHKFSSLKGAKAKLRFEEKLKTSGINYSIVYPNGFFSDMGSFLELAKKGRIYLFGGGPYKINPIHGADLAREIVGVIPKDLKSIELGGPEVFTHEEISKIAFETIGKPYRVTKIPIWIKNTTLFFLRAFTKDRVYGPVEFFMTVLSINMVAPKKGTHKLKDYYNELNKKTQQSE